MASQPDANEPRQRLIDLRNGLLRLHKVLLESERAAYDRDIQRITSSAQFLELVLHDPWFAWLRELSQFVVWIDERMDAEEPADASETGQVIKQARALLTPAEEGKGFGKNYFAALQRDPSVVLAHGEMMKVFAQLAQAT
jgi:hypothetical protein